MVSDVVRGVDRLAVNAVLIRPDEGGLSTHSVVSYWYSISLPTSTFAARTKSICRYYSSHCPHHCMPCLSGFDCLLLVVIIAGSRKWNITLTYVDSTIRTGVPTLSISPQGSWNGWNEKGAQ